MSVYLSFESASARQRLARIRELLDGQKMTAAELASGVSLDRSKIYYYLRHLRERGEIRIASWTPACNRTPLYTLGAGEDAERPGPKPPKPRIGAPALEGDDQEVLRAIEAARKRALKWKPHRDPLTAAFFGGATA